MSSLCKIEDEIFEIVVEEEVCEIIDQSEVPIIRITEDVCRIVVEDPTKVVVTEETPQPIITECKVGPPGADGADGLGVIQINSGPVSNGNTVAADGIAIATYRSVKWLVTLTDSTAGLYKHYEVMAVHNGTVPFHSVYGRVGDGIPVDTNVEILAGVLRLEITNNHPNDLLINAVRIVTTI